MNNFHMREGKVEFRWKRWRNKKRQEVSSCLMVLFSGVVLLGAGGVALAGPTGGQITGGSGTITTPNGTTTNINQQSNVLNINWQDFSIGANETVNFYQPGSTSVAINRVIGGVPSYLAGALNANGRVFILNSAGITFTGTSQVNVGALLATTAMTVNGDPTQAASYSGTGYGAVINQGSISVSNGGFAILAAPYVQNTGFIKADLGTIALAGTNQFTLDLSGTGLINFVVPAGAVEQIVSDGKAVGVDNSGTLQARSGQVVISANVASEVINAVVNLNGIVDADAFAPNGQGGAVLVTAAGDINVGGHVTARGDGTGNGGQIVTKAVGDDNIEQMAFVSAAGGATGVGGHIEVSGKTVGLNGSIDPGKGGLLFIDPVNFIIKNGTSGSTLSGIGEHKLEALLQNGAGFLVSASHNITIQDLTDNVLAGGAGDLTLHAGTGVGGGNIIVQGVGDTIRTGSGDVTLTANGGNIGDAGHRLSFVSGTGLAGVSQAGDILLTATKQAAIGGSIFVNTVTVKSAGNSHFHALFSANAGNSFNAAGLIDVETRASGAGAQTADAGIHINAGNHIQLHGITDLATAFKNADGGHNVIANASVMLNGTQLHDTGAMTVTANVLGHSANSFLADADLEITGAGNVSVTGGAVDVTAKASAFNGHNVFADAEAFIDPITLGPITLDSVFVNANVQALTVGRVCAIASFAATGSRISIAHDAIVTATANNENLGRSASATANLFLTAFTGAVSVHGNVGVTATALNGGGSQDADANAHLDINAHDGILVDGNVTVIANAQTLLVASSDSSTPRACAIASFHADSGGIHIRGGLDVEAIDSSLNSDSVIARARARLVTSNNNNPFGSTVLGRGSIEIDGPTKVSATAKTNAQNVFEFGPSSGAFASASLMVHAEGHVQMDAVTVKASASDLGRFQANAIAHANIISRDSGISISGSVDVEANAQDPVGNYASANAEANIQASGDIDVLGNVEVNATAQQTSGGTSHGGAFARANLHIVASSSSEGVTDVNVNGNIGVHALAETNGSGSATANAEVLLSAGGSSSGGGGDVTVNGSIGVTATANQVSNSGEGAQACANLEIDASSHTSSVALINVNGDITVDAFARSNGTGNVTANAQAAIGGHGSDVEDGSSSFSFGTAVNVTVNGNIDVSATANHVGSGAGAALALANLDIDASSGSVNVNGDIGVHANAQTNGSGGLVLNAFGSSSSTRIGAAAVARAEIAAEATSSIHVQHGSNAFDVTVNGHVEVTAIANQLNTDAGDGALACAALDMDAKFSFGLINVNGDVTVNALAKDMGTGAAHANAVAEIDAQGSVLIHGNVGVNASAEQLNTSGDSARACANLRMSASSGNVNVNGDVGAHANALASGTESAHANTRVNIFGSDGIDITGNVAALASANQHGTGGESAHACANLQLVAGSSEHAADVNVNGDVTGSANAFSRGSESAIANAFVNIQADRGDVIVNGVVTANANALASSTRGFSGARANASMSIVGDPVTLGGIVDHATADSHGNQFANAQANVHVTGADVEIDGDVSVIANAQTDNQSNHATGARANAQVFIHASGTSSIDQLTITGSVNVLASASDLHTVTSHANALANVSLTAAGNGSQAALDLGDVRVIANALDHDGVGLTLANAQVLISASNAAHGGVQMGSLDVTASANEVAGNANAHASAVANALLNAVNVVSATGSDVLVTANAFDGSGANASATLNVNAGHVLLGSEGGFDLDSGLVGARALAVANGAIAKAKALANVQINAGTGNASIFGVLEAVATASYDHPGGNALANTIASGLANVFACNNITADQINVTAKANNHGNKSAQALASLNFNAGGSITLEDADLVSATADNFSGNGASGGGATGALANANAHFNGTGIFGTSESSQSITVRAHAINAGHNAAKALALLDFGSATQVNLGGITLDVLASDLRANDNGAGASANAALVQTNGMAHWFIGTHGLNVQAVAHSHGTNVANAHASIDILQNTITIGGPVTVNAEASAGANAHGALAIANLLLNATTGALSVGDGSGSEHDILVKANAHNLGHNHANAQADASLLGNTFVYTENVEVDALAFDSHANGGADTKANAQLLASADNGPVSMGSIGVFALADRVDGSDAANGAVAIANAHLVASDYVWAEGGISVLAVAQDPGGAYANASAELLASADRVLIGQSSNQAPIFSSGSIQVNLAANYGVLVGAIAIFSNSLGLGHAQADANANLVADVGDVELSGAADVLGVAVDQGGAFANADADLLVNANTFAHVGSGSLQLTVANDSGVFANLTINEGVFVAGVAIDTANGFVDAGADASFLANHNNVSIDHGIDELAIGITDNGTHANAQAHLLVNAGSNTVITGGSISANLFSGHISLGSLLGGSQIGVLQAAVAVDGGVGTGHHANALAETNIDPNLVQINGDVVVVAAAIDNSGTGATANANLFIHANHVAIGTESGHANIIVAAIAVESGTQGASVNAHANARIIVNNASSGAISINDITVLASADNPRANSSGVNDSAIAHMLLQASNGGVKVGDVNVAAAASLQGSVSADAFASASAAIRAKKHINVNGDITVSALATTDSGAGDADASAILKLKTTGSTGSIDVQGHILVNAVANGGGQSSAIANATANIQGNAGVTLHSGVDVEANADQSNSSGTDARACANLDIDAASGSVTINGSAVANAQAETEGSGNASAYALTEIEAFSGDVNVTGNIDVTANAKESSSSSGQGAHANANLAVAALGSGLQSINLTGNITVNAQAQGNGGSSENTGDSVTANAEAQIGGGGNPTNITINGNTVVVANALYSGESGSQDALANANLDIDATSGALVMRGNVLVNAVAEEDGSGSALANAQAELAAENNGSGGGSGSVNVVGNITVLANADVDNSSSGDGAHACANLAILASSGSITLTGNIGVDARAVGNGNSGSSDSVTAQANAQIGGLESGFAGGSDNVFIRGNIAVTAEASYTGDSEVEALACANLDIDGSSGQVSIVGNVTVDASALDEGEGSAIAHATAEIGAENAGSHFDTDVTIIGNIAMRANAQKTGSNSGIASANANLTIVSDDGNVFITGGINASATAFDQGSGNASAFACVAITASHSIVMSGGDIITRAKATYAFSTDAAAVASDAISVHARNVALRGVRGSATAQVSSESAANAQAVTNIGISAGSNISIGPDGVLGFAGATAGSDNGRASANVQMALDAGTNGAGNLFVRGNVIAVAGAFGGGTNNVAHANAHMAAGGATEFSTGAPSNFGNIAVIGDIGAFAFADATSDVATASVEIFAHNNLLIVGNDPIASAHVGPSGGTVFAFRQAHFTTHDGTNFGPGGGALADIDIRAGGFVAVFPTSSLSHVEKLYSLPTDDPTLNSSLGLTIIPLSVDGEDCGVLGIAGKDQSAINKALACHHKPINVSDLTDTGP